jgi:hypothetical protein
MTLVPASGDVRKDRQNRELVIIIPKDQRIVPQKQQTKRDDNQAGAQCAEKIASRK